MYVCTWVVMPNEDVGWDWGGAGMDRTLELDWQPRYVSGWDEELRSAY